MSRRRHVDTVDVPESHLLANALPRVDWADAYAVSFPDGPPGDPQQWAEAAFRTPPPLWVVALFGVREAFVRIVGIEPGGSHVFDTVARTDREVLVGADQGHLGFRASVLLEPTRVVLTTVVQVNNRRGAFYSAIVRRVHPAVVRTMLARAARVMARPMG